ncbi:hypothetical protein Peur_047292 [Populus x canadensis]
MSMMEIAGTLVALEKSLCPLNHLAICQIEYKEMSDKEPRCYTEDGSLLKLNKQSPMDMFDTVMASAGQLSAVSV